MYQNRLHIVVIRVSPVLKVPYYVKNNVIHNDLNIPSITEEVKQISLQHADRLDIATTLQ